MGRLVAFGICTMWLAVSQAAFAAEDLIFMRACDASAAIVLPSGDIAVVDDENPDVIWVYNIAGSQSPLTSTSEVPLEDHLRQKNPKKEADLEGVAPVGEHIYWVGSHSRSGEGEREVHRRALFATDWDLKPVGTVYGSLLEALVDGDKTWKVGLTGAIGDVSKDADCKSGQVPCLAPEKNGLSIEGLGYLPPARDGSRQASVLIGLRNPLGPGDKALLLPLLNVGGVVMDQAEPRFGEPIPLGLDGLGVRDLAWSEELGAMLVLAGTKDDHPDFRLYRWSGEHADEPKELTRITELNPEAVVAIGRHKLLLLSDDGDRKFSSTEQDCKKKHFENGECACKHLIDQSRKQFRGRFVTIE